VTREPLVCPSCGAGYAREERFCRDCGMPLVPAQAAPPPTEREERLRKLKPQYTEGPLVRVARAGHQAEAELIQNLLLEAGIPSMTRRSGGFDVPDFLAAGPRDVLVPRSAQAAARDVLSGGELPAADAGEPPER
jgi:Putative prokaryotic signal transducing protein